MYPGKAVVAKKANQPKPKQRKGIMGYAVKVVAQQKASSTKASSPAVTGKATVQQPGGGESVLDRSLRLWQNIASEASVPKPLAAKAVDPKPPPPKPVEPKKAAGPKKAAEPKLEAAGPKPKAVEPKPAKLKAVEPKQPKKAVPQPPPPKTQAMEPQGGLHSFFARRAPPAQEVPISKSGAHTSKSADDGPSEAILPSIEENDGGPGCASCGAE